MTSLVARRARPLLLLYTTPLRHLRSLSTSRTKPSPFSSSDTNSSTLSIQLTPAEDSLFSFLEYIQQLYAPTTQLRVAGGWVRDKLRGHKSEDIDIALSNLKGATFAQYITKFQRDRKLPRSSVGLVKANSSKSKHLEVATVTIDGFNVDFVHLRAEQYSVNSRVPNVAFATPEDDARRRDLTINALFYNLHTRLIEDYTGKGMEDLNKGVIRTPREPEQTFLDDPLRVLRAIRFACEFGFTLDSALARAVLEERAIVRAMSKKLSRERIGIEVRKMLAGNDPARAFELLKAFKLLDLVFNGSIDEGHEHEGTDQIYNTFQYAPRNWTEVSQNRASHCLKYLQHVRREVSKGMLSDVEATAAILTPVFLSTVPIILPTEHLRTTLPTFEGMPEQELVESSLAFLAHRDAITAALDSNEIVEMLKVHVKWPKPAGKRVALMIEAIATYPEALQNLKGSDADVKHCVHQFMWMTQYHSVIVPALTILVSARTFDSDSVDEETRKMQDEMLKAYLDVALTYAKEITDAPDDESRGRRRVDGKTVQTRLGPGARREITQALSVLDVWEKAHPNASLEDELAFLDRLTPRLRECVPAQLT